MLQIGATVAAAWHLALVQLMQRWYISYSLLHCDSVRKQSHEHRTDCPASLPVLLTFEMARGQCNPIADELAPAACNGADHQGCKDTPWVQLLGHVYPAGNEAGSEDV